MIEKVKDTNLILPFIKKFFSNYVLQDNPYEKIICYRIDGKVVGFISYSIIYERAELNYIAVDKSYRRRGIAQKLLDFVLEELKNNMVENFSLEVSVDNLAAKKFYLKNGFKIKAIRRKYYDGVDAYLMVLGGD